MVTRLNDSVITYVLLKNIDKVIQCGSKDNRKDCNHLQPLSRNDIQRLNYVLTGILIHGLGGLIVKAQTKIDLYGESKINLIESA